MLDTAGIGVVVQLLRPASDMQDAVQLLAPPAKLRARLTVTGLLDVIDVVDPNLDE